MSDMDFVRYEMMVEECSAETHIIEYRDTTTTLVACVLIDQLMDGLSMVYSFFDPEEHKRSLGNLMILDHIQRCRDLDCLTSILAIGFKVALKWIIKPAFGPMKF